MQRPVGQSRAFSAIRLLQYATLVTGVAAIYGSFLESPLVFDDFVNLEARNPQYLQAIFRFELRWLPYASIEWTRQFLGEHMLWLRLENLALHGANALLLFLFLRRLFEVVLVPETPAVAANPGGGLSLAWLAFFGALLFALHPAAVYGVAYLIERAILMATFFALSSWILFLEGLLRNQRRWLWASGLAYLLAVLSKEHAIMVPAVALALLVLVRRPDRQYFARTWPILLLFGAGAGCILVLFRMQGPGAIGRAYEPYAADLFASGKIDPRNAYPLSVLTQGYLYFKYLLLWLIPNPSWMSADMSERFAPRLLAYPETVGLIAFVLYPALAIRLLWRRGSRGLLGFALLSPWLLFATELSTVRIQEIFVIYRSYLWMPCLFAALPFLLRKLAARYAAAILAAIVLALIPASWDRLTSFSDPLLFWSDALQLARDKNDPLRLGRIYHNRGLAYLNKYLYEEAIRDFSIGIKLRPRHIYLYNDRAVAYLSTGRYQEALNDFNMAIVLDQSFYNPFLGRARALEALGQHESARWDYIRSCGMGAQQACDKLLELAAPARTLP